MSFWSQKSNSLTAAALEDEDHSIEMESQNISNDSEKYFAAEVLRDPAAIHWEEFSETYEQTDPSLSVLAEYFANGTDLSQITSVPSYCKTIMHELSDAELDYSWNQLVPCVSYTNVTRALHDGRYSKNLTDALSAYKINGTDDSVLLGDRLASVIGRAMHFNCKILRCGMEREDKWGLEDNDKPKGHGEEEEDERDTAPDMVMSRSCQNLFLNNVTLSFDATNRCQADICIRARNLLTADPEIGGPGVFISYATQLLIAIIFMFYFFLKYISPYYHRNCHSAVYNCHYPAASVSSNVFGRRDAHPAFTNALESFQKLQAWFSASLVIAACIRQATHQVSDTDHYLLLCVSLNGVVLIPLTLLIMQQLGRKAGWSTFYLSSGAFAMCAGFMYISVCERKNSLYSLSSLWHHSQWCGRESFFAVALPHFWAIHNFLHIVDAVPNAVFWCTLTVCSASLLALFIIRLEMHEVARARVSWLSEAERVFKFVTAFSYAAILVLLLILLIPFVAVVNWEFSAWGFGQIVALSVFMPVLYDYLSERFTKSRMNPVSPTRVYENDEKRRSIFSSHHLCCHKLLVLDIDEKGYDGEKERWV